MIALVIDSQHIIGIFPLILAAKSTLYPLLTLLLVASLPTSLAVKNDCVFGEDIDVPEISFVSEV